MFTSGWKVRRHKKMAKVTCSLYHPFGGVFADRSRGVGDQRSRAAVRTVSDVGRMVAGRRSSTAAMRRTSGGLCHGAGHDDASNFLSASAILFANMRLHDFSRIIDK